MDIVDRVKSILLTPKSEWLVIEREPGDPTYLFTNYVAILAAIPAVCGFIGTSIIGISLPVIGTVRVGIVSGIASAIVNYLLAFVMVYVMGLIIDALAPTFNGQKKSAQCAQTRRLLEDAGLARRYLLAHPRLQGARDSRPLWPLS